MRFRKRPVEIEAVLNMTPDPFPSERRDSARDHKCNLNTEVERGHWLGLRHGWGGRCLVCGRAWRIT